MKTTLKQAKNDLEYLFSNYGMSYDFCGATCENDLLDDLMSGEISRLDAYIHCIKAYWDQGTENMGMGITPDEIRPDDARVKRIMERYEIAHYSMDK